VVAVVVQKKALVALVVQAVAVVVMILETIVEEQHLQVIKDLLVVLHFPTQAVHELVEVAVVRVQWVLTLLAALLALAVRVGR
jgi:hypothetical protein